MTTVPRLRVRGLRAGYHKTEVVHGIDLEVHAGEVVALFGGNGAGKTTTMLTLMGCLPRLGGEIFWGDADTRLPAHQRARSGVSFVPERSVFHGISAEANLRLGKGDPATALELFPELVPLLRRRAGLLSGGEQQMLAMGRALAASPSVLLLDEISAGLAPVVVTRLFDAVRRAADEGTAVLLVEQQIRRALSVADRCYVLTRGEIALSGTVTELTAQRDTLEGAYFARGGPAVRAPRSGITR